ncbi:bifunctional alpha,alpha-trehalose-phosphate synthase (UDP-forming)/trehalose-phosphatase [Thermospira aquatica]|uniref:Bifunctional alpha,alpha-trehalose-phosphate synthase (UDP-forming)/trehalose-phosphatase n=1 Tax=Thermospira aquatica TaxID=2828656 RepID=A0AAX3BB51_9SPIR|nr:bifunctional alpha,alpha-trehalose-phosphate synthase (UDP-forming)/trehalose-phosphatase [Thermospira aquatica]URA09249.1 bifunctional alpha,alpha-trehalose-phosphate synthase (UDP-forming)/trehalose-phosphatase [Thermospira aquatica]
MLKILIEEIFPNKNLIVVSNREPYIHKKIGSSIKIEKPAGGLTSAMDDVLKITGGTWVAWGSGSGDKDVVDNKNRIPVPPENPSYKLKRVWLSPSEVENYYHGYSNQVLWPLCHITPERVYYRKQFWADYKKVNGYFAKAILEEADENSVVWIHDYHLCLLPEILRKENPKLTIAHFWHIPWPNWTVFRISPQAKEIIKGLLGNDLIGFQIPFFVKNFMDCVTQSIEDAEVDHKQGIITYQGHITRLRAFPISIDFDKFNAIAASRKTDIAIRKIKKYFGITTEAIGIGVDRLEYTKALIKRLQAIDLFFEKYEKFRQKFIFIQIAVPTRMREPYLSYKRAVEELVAKINKKYSIGTWKPIIYIDTKIEQKELAAYYKMADFAIISSIYDGMNLVAKEYVASKTDEKGVLILSEFTGASEELEDSILVNPYDIEQFAESIKIALKMPDKEKMARMSILRRQVRENNIHKWVVSIMKEIAAIAAIKNEKCYYLFDNLDEIQKRFHKNIFLFLDYDGTLTPIAETPDQAVISDDMRSLIIKLKEHIPVAVISGRALKDVKEKIGIEDIIYAGNHGAEIWDGNKIIINQNSMENRDLLEELLDKLTKALAHIQGVWVEDKGITASLHFRNVAPNEVGEVFSTFDRIAREYKENFRFITGKKVFEIRPLNIWNKGNAVSWIIENMGENRFPIYIGDDTTDEDAYIALQNRGLSISIGGSVNANSYLQSQEEVKRFLTVLYEELNK